MKRVNILPILVIACVLILSVALPAQTEDDALDKEAAYYATVRYVIVYDILYDLEPEERRVSILLLPEQFSRQSLTEVFKLISKRFPKPIRLRISVHTSLRTIETPEENEMAKDSDDTRFRRFLNKYKTAYFRRDEEGENFCYTTSLKPYKATWAYPLTKNGRVLPCY